MTEQATSSAEAILRRAQQELEDREGRLQAFADEMVQVRGALKVIRKALEAKPRGASTLQGGKATSGRNPRREAIDKILDVLTDAPEPMLPSEISLAAKLKAGGWLDGLLAQATSAGELVKIGDRFGLAHAYDRERAAEGAA